MQVVVGVDGSSSSLAALRWAADEARHRQWPLAVVHAVPATRPPPGARGREALLERAAEPSADVLTAALQDQAAAVAGLAVRPVVVRGRFPERALEHAASEAGLLTVGRGASGVRGLLGSVSGHLAAHASCPVEIVPAGWAPPLERIVVGVDGSPAAAAAVEWAAAEALLHGAEIELVHAYLPYRPGRPFGAEFMEVASPHAERRLRRMAESVVDAALSTPAAEAAGARGRVVPGAATQALVAASRDAGLLVVGRSGIGLPHRLPGSVCRGVLHQAPGPVAVVPLSVPAGR